MMENRFLLTKKLRVSLIETSLRLYFSGQITRLRIIEQQDNHESRSMKQEL
jgi:hypothetical protein